MNWELVAFISFYVIVFGAICAWVVIDGIVKMSRTEGVDKIIELKQSKVREIDFEIRSKKEELQKVDNIIFHLENLIPETDLKTLNTGMLLDKLRQLDKNFR